MRAILSALVGLAFVIKLSAQETNAPVPPKMGGSTLLKIGAAEATNYFDQVMTVTGKVAQVTIRPKVTFLNLDQPYPDSPLTVVIFHGYSQFYGDANALRGKDIEIKGRVKNYHGKPEIALDRTNQLTVLDFANSIISTNAPMTTTNVPPAAASTNFPAIM